MTSNQPTDAELRRIAEAATEGEWGVVGREGRALNPNPTSSAVHVSCRAQHDAAHVAAFNPPTVLALLDRLEAAEAAVARVRALADEWERSSPAWRDPVDGPVTELRAALDQPTEREA